MTPSDRQIPSALLASLYGVLDDQARWPEFLHGCCDFVGTTFASLTSLAVDPTPMFLRVFLWGLSDEDTHEYRRSWIARDPWAKNADLSAIISGTVARGEDYCPDEELERNEAYVGFLKARNMHHGAGAFLVKSERICTILSVSRSKRAGRLSELEMDRIRWLVPHLQRVVRIQDETSGLMTQRDILRDLFDQSAAGVVLLDQRGAVLTANARAQAALDSGMLLSTKERLMRASCGECDKALQEAIDRVLDPFEDSSGGEIVSLGKKPSGQDDAGPRLRLLVLPAGHGGTLAPSSGSPAVVVHIFDPAAMPHIDQETLRKFFQLSKAEATVAESLACGFSVAETADHLHVSHHTVRSHLKSLFLKTRTTQQSALVSLILRLQSPMPTSLQDVH